MVGWTAVDTPFSRSNLGRLKAGTRVVFELVDPLTKVVATHATRTSAEGKFWAELPVPVGASFGRITVRVAVAGHHSSTAVRVEDYRTPEFEVDAHARRPDILLGEQNTIDLRASYYFGGPVPMTRVAQTTDCTGIRYQPPGLEDSWEVGEWPVYIPRVGGGFDAQGRPAVLPPPVDATSGRRTLTAGGAAVAPQNTQRCTVSAMVQDASMQEVGAETGFTVHPAAFYLAVAAPSVAAGERDDQGGEGPPGPHLHTILTPRHPFIVKVCRGVP